MPLKVNVKRREAKFKGDKPKYNTVVSGPRETFTKPLCRLLETQGLAPFIDEGGLVVWSSMPQIGGAPYYLCHLLAFKYNAVIHSSCKKQAESVVSKRDTIDGIDHILGSQGALPPGRMKLQVISSSTDFAVNCDENDEQRRSFLEAAGWLPIKNVNPRIVEKLGTQPYRTRDPFIASNLEPFLSASAKKLMQDKLKLAGKSIKDSKSHTGEGAIDVPAPEGLGFFPFQRKGVTMAMDSPGGAIIADDMGLGKAQPLDAGILTPDGWVRMADISVGDQVIGSDGKPTEVLGVYPQGLKEIFEVSFTDGSSTECCDEHLWAVNAPVRKRRGNSNKVMTLQDIRNDLLDGAGNRKHYIPMVKPVEFSEKLFDVDPYLLGALLGDGGLTTHCIRFSSADQEVLDQVKQSIPEGLTINHVYNYDYSISSHHAGSPNELIRSLKRIGLMGKGSDDKFIPHTYFRGSTDQRLSLLQGLLDTDGYISKTGTIQFSSNSLHLADGVSEIVMSLGGGVRRSVKVSSSGKNHYTVTIALPDGIDPFRLTRKLERHNGRVKYKPARGFKSIRSVGVKPAQCIRVAAEDSLYVTDNYIVTHNTMQGIGIINTMHNARRVLIICQANMRIKWGQEVEKWKVDADKTVGVAESSNFPDTDVCVINYDILTKNLAALRADDWDLIICDEAHNMKNPEAQRTQAVLGDLLDSAGVQSLPLSDNGKIVHLTGTPKPNRIDELWPLISSTRPDIWGSGPEDFQIFKNRYCPPVLIRKQMPSKFGGKPREIIIPMAGKPIRETELHLRLRGSGSFVRRMKRDNPDLPPKFRTPLDVPVRLSKDEKEALRSAEFDLQEMLAKTKNGSVVEGNSTLAGAVIKQITNLNPDTPAFHEMARVRRNLGLIKAPHCAKFIIDELEAEKEFAPENRTKTVVFAHHKDVIKVIHAEAEKRMKGAFLVYDGSVGSAKKKQALVDRFQTDDKIRGMIISLSGNSGITLTESARMRVVEPDWSPSNMIQIEDRIWRIGQEKNVDIGYMSVAGTLDAKIGLAIASKMETDEMSINSIGFRHKAPSQIDRLNVDKTTSSPVEGESEQQLSGNNGGREAEEQASLPLFG